MSPEYKYPKPEKDEEGYENWGPPRDMEMKCSTQEEPVTEKINTDIGEVAALNFYGGKHSKYSEFHEEKRENHDSLAVFEDKRYVYMIVIDGMGGHEKAGEFSEELTHTLKEELKSEKGPIFSLNQVFSKVQKEMEEFPSEEAGAVVTTTMIDKESNTAEIANLGDSRSAIISENGEIKAASEIQTVAAMAYENKHDEKLNLITREFINKFLPSNKFNLTNNATLGEIDSRKDSGLHQKTNELDLDRISVESGDFVILGSDGIINEAVTVSEIAKEIQNNPDQSADELRDKIYQKMKEKLQKVNEEGKEEITTIDEEGEEMKIPAKYAKYADNMSLIVLKKD
ncbi:MAG: PP2C family serine/threonine-protein phosphatase [Candidatus Paceibacteria bacterium]